VDVAILDYGTGNLHSLAKGLQAGGATVRILEEVGVGFDARALVLPGVGAFGAAAARLGRSAAAIRAAAGRGLPCLGICLGMQLLFEASEEGPGAGLGLLRGRVRRVRAPLVPHMGWNDAVPARPDPLFPADEPLVAYFAHGFAAEPAEEASVLAWTGYGPDRFPAAVRRGTVCGVQFHPEKSGAAGLGLLRRFLAEAAR
jgi:glutamine amidotransferase